MPICKTDNRGILTPEYHRGDIIRIQPRSFEKPCPGCGRHFSCFELGMEILATVLQDDFIGAACPCCMVLVAENDCVYVKEKNGITSSVPYTWIEGIVEHA